MKHPQPAIYYSSSQRDYNCKLQICQPHFIKYIQASLIAFSHPLTISGHLQIKFNSNCIHVAAKCPLAALNHGGVFP